MVSFQGEVLDIIHAYTRLHTIIKKNCIAVSVVLPQTWEHQSDALWSNQLLQLQVVQLLRAEAVLFCEQVLALLQTLQSTFFKYWLHPIPHTAIRLMRFIWLDVLEPSIKLKK